MNLPPFVPTIDGTVRDIIVEKLRGIERDFNVRVLFAIESGSRAWGFPSPDSDYDVRFVYVHSVDWYLSLLPGRDVIELPIEGDWDINGWELRKPLNLLLKPNPVLLEWLSSPTRYIWDEGICATLSEIAGRTTFGHACLHHYKSLAFGQWQKHVGDASDVNYKKYFYILRPALAIHWIRSNPGTTPPMNLQALVAGLPLSSEIVVEINTLLDLKAKAKEVGLGPRVDLIDAYIFEQINWAGDVSPPVTDRLIRADAEALFRKIVSGIDL